MYKLSSIYLYIYQRLSGEVLRLPLSIIMFFLQIKSVFQGEYCDSPNEYNVLFTNIKIYNDKINVRVCRMWPNIADDYTRG